MYGWCCLVDKGAIFGFIRRHAYNCKIIKKIPEEKAGKIQNLKINGRIFEIREFSFEIEFPFVFCWTNFRTRTLLGVNSLIQQLILENSAL